MKPPALALWILSRLVPSSPHTEAISGDLQERLAEGHSTSWFWRQVVWAVLVGNVRDIRNDKVLLIKGIAIGWAVVLLFLTIVSSPLASLEHWGLDALMAAMTGADGTWAFAGAERLVISYLRATEFPVAASVAFVLAGWLIGHRQQNLAVMLAFSMTVFALFAVPARVFYFTAAVPMPSPLRSVFVLRLDDLGIGNAAFMWVPMLIVMGGILGAGVRRKAPLVA